MDNVSSQDHYKTVGREIDSMEFMWRNFTSEEYIGFMKGNILKYFIRYKKKGGLVDLKKMWVYLTWVIFSMEHPDKQVPKNIDQILDKIINGVE